MRLIPNILYQSCRRNAIIEAEDKKGSAKTLEQNLNGRWKLYWFPDSSRQVAEPEKLCEMDIPSAECTVPGNVELDLSAAGVLPEDLFRGMNILEAEKYELYEWWYERSFVPEAPQDGESVILTFGAVDCIADYYLNGRLIGHSENMFIEQRFDVTEKLRYGESNTLHVNIKSAVAHANNERIEPLELSVSWLTSSVSQVVRKAPHSYGWDIMPRAVSAGIWRGVSLVYRPKYHFKYAYFHLCGIGKEKSEAELVFSAEMGAENAFTHHRMVIKGSCGGHEIYRDAKIYSCAGRVRFELDSDTLWWPKNYGKPNMYDLTVEMYGADGRLCFAESFRQGFRTVELFRTDTVCDGGGFEFRVNGMKIMAVGSNWVPMDAYHSRDAQRYARALELAEDIGCNILRCWGGNVYEDTEFFDFFDEHGIMVWQDFAMACHFYPQTPEFFAKLEEEVTAVVEKLRNHPSLVLWCGDNEIDSMVSMFTPVKPSVNRISREVIPNLLRRLDPFRPYIPSSPYISDEAYALGRDYYPEEHLWGPRDYFKSSYYTTSKAYFVSETGYHGCPARVSIEKFIDKDKVWPYFDNEQWILHASEQHGDPSRTMLMHRQVDELFGRVPEDMDRFVTASQISQAEAKKFFIERVRAQMDRMGGVIWWNLIDGWPQMSDAVVDYYYEKKLAYNYIRRSSRPVLAFIGEMEDWGHPVLISNSTAKPSRVSVKVTDIASGKTVFTGEGEAEPNSNARVGFIPLMYSRKGMFLIEYTADGIRAVNTYLYGMPGFELDSYIEWMRAADEAESRL